MRAHGKLNMAMHMRIMYASIYVWNIYLYNFTMYTYTYNFIILLLRSIASLHNIYFGVRVWHNIWARAISELAPHYMDAHAYYTDHTVAMWLNMNDQCKSIISLDSCSMWYWKLKSAGIILCISYGPSQIKQLKKGCTRSSQRRRVCKWRLNHQAVLGHLASNIK